MKVDHKKKVFVVGWEFSRLGGIEEVSRQVLQIIDKSDMYDLIKIEYPRSRYIAYLFRIYLMFRFSRDSLVMFMHPYIYEQFKSFPSFIDRMSSVVWAYGIDVWGDYGKAHTTALVKAKRVVAISDYTRTQLLVNYPDLNVCKVSLATELQTKTFSNGMRNRVDNVFTVLTVSRLSASEAYKGHDLVIEAVNVLRKRGVIVKYNIVGKGDDMPRLRSLVQNYEIGDQVQFSGYVPDADMDNIYLNASVFVMPSRVIRRSSDIWGGEGFGLVYLEAGLHGLPVIACNVGGQTDCVVDGVTGYLVDPCVLSVADKIQYLYENPDVCSRMGEAGRLYVGENFTPNKFRDNVLKVIDEVFNETA